MDKFARNLNTSGEPNHLIHPGRPDLTLCSIAIGHPRSWIRNWGDASCEICIGKVIVGSSFGHTIDAPALLPWYARKCSRKCSDLTRYVSSYRYVTGKAGLTATAVRCLCPVHAAMFAKVNKLALPEIPPDQKLAEPPDWVKEMRSGRKPE